MPLSERFSFNFYHHKFNQIHFKGPGSKFYVESYDLPDLDADCVIIDSEDVSHTSSSQSPANICSDLTTYLEYNPNTGITTTKVANLTFNDAIRNKLGFSNTFYSEIGSKSEQSSFNKPVGCLYFNTQPIYLDSTLPLRYYQRYDLRFNNTLNVFSVKILDGQNYRDYYGNVNTVLIYGDFQINFRESAILTDKISVGSYKEFTIAYLYSEDVCYEPIQNFPIIPNSIVANHTWVKLNSRQDLVLNCTGVALILFR